MTTTVRSIDDVSVPGASRTNGHVDRETQDNSPGSRMTYSRLIGALFLLGFLFYGVGTALATSVTNAPDFLSALSAHQSMLALGAFLILLNTGVEVAKGVLFFPILENHGKRTAFAFLAAVILEAVLMAVGALCLLVIIPLGQYAADTGQASAAWANGIAAVLNQSNTMAYQIAEMSLGIGGLFLCSLLFRTRMIPRVLAVAGFIGYISFVVGTVAEVFGIHIGLVLSFPGIPFEVAMPIWLFVKGFRPDVYQGRVKDAVTPTIAGAIATA